MQRVGDRARAVIPLGLERAVPAAEHIRPGRDFIRGRDHAGHDARGFAFAARGAGRARSRAVGHVAAARAEPRQGAAGGVSVLASLTPITLQVAGPTTPSTVSPWRACRRRTAASVSGPKVAVDGHVQRLLQPRDRVGGDLRFGGAGRRSLLATADTTPAWWEAGAAIAEGGGVSVSAPLTPITLHVAGPTMPSTVSPWRACRRRTAASVSGPKSPSTGRCSACCSRATALPPTRAAVSAEPALPSVSLASSVWTPAAAADAGGPAAQCGARQRSDDAVDREPVAGLEVLHRRFGFGAEDAVDGDAERAAGAVRPDGRCRPR